MAHHADLGEVRIVFEDEGSGVPVLLLHGIPTQRYLWRKVVPILTDRGLRCVAPDLAGFGSSEAPPNVGIHVANQAAWMAELLRELGIERAVVVGHDIGGAVAQILATRHGSSVAGLVLVDSVFDDGWPVEAMRRLADWDPAAAGKLHDLFLQRLPKTSTVHGMSDADVRVLLAPYEGEEGGRKLIRMARSLDSSYTRAVAGKLPNLDVPVAVLWGDEDAFLPADTVGSSLAGALGVRLQVVHAGHFAPEDAPGPIAETIVAVAAEVAARP